MAHTATYCGICQSEQDERAIQYAYVAQSTTVHTDWGTTYDNPTSHTITACSDCIATHSFDEMTELLITIAEEN